MPAANQSGSFAVVLKRSVEGVVNNVIDLVPLLHLLGDMIVPAATNVCVRAACLENNFAFILAIHNLRHGCNVCNGRPTRANLLIFDWTFWIPKACSSPAESHARLWVT